MRRPFTLICFMLLIYSASALAQPERRPQMPPEEQKAVQAIFTAPDPAQKVKAATDFVKKYPQSPVRKRVARGVADQIAGVTDPAQKVTLAQSYQQAFTETAEQEIILPILINALEQVKRPDEGFTTGAAFLGKNPDSLPVLLQLVGTAADEAKNKNGKFVAQGLQYGAHSIQLIEAGAKPADIDDAVWAKYKTDMLPSLYEQIGLLNLVSGDRSKAIASYMKASELAPAEVFNFLMLAQLLNAEYQDMGKNYQKMPNGPAKEAELKKAQASLDKVIDAYARAIALSEGNARYEQVRQQFMQDFESYYKYRHNGSTEGMQQLIQKYKPAAKP